MAGLLVLVIGAAVVLYQQRSPTATLFSGPVNSMHFFSPSEGWVLSERLLVTRDGGSHWRDVSPGPRLPPTELSAASFLDPRHGWAVTVGGLNVPSDVIRIFRTMDGGNTWASSQISAEAHLGLSLDFVDPRDGWLIVGTETGTMASAGRLFRTADGSATWSELPPPPSGHPVHFIDLTTGWNVGGANLDQLFVSTDGGHGWRQQNVPVPPDYADIAFELAAPTFVDKQLGILRVLFPDGSVLLEFTTDGGATWSIDGSRAPLFIRRPPYPTGNVDAPTFFGKGVMAVLLGAELHVQSGSGWKSIKPRGLDSVLQIEFLNPHIGWAMASGSCPAAPYGRCLRVLWTADGGSTWAPVPVG
jgi:photosystem II stability/assembly factor-like uncharacterized protein